MGVPKMYRGSSVLPKLWVDRILRDLVRGRRALYAGRSHTGRSGGLHTSEDAGMSNDKRSENLRRRKPKVSSGR